jgi:hypothetical protein
VRAALLLLLAFALAPGGGAAAQERPAAPTDTLTPAQRALERLRTLRAPGAPDTLQADTAEIRPQGLRVDGGRGAERTAPSRIQRDDIMSRLLGLEGYVVTEYSGDSARFFADINRLELRGNPQVAREGSQLVADSSIIYSQRQAVACGYGNPVLHAVGQAEPLASDTVCFDVDRRLGRAFGASTRVQEGATWNVRCDAYFVGDQLYCHDAIFTDCELPYPHQHYAFGAKELKAIRGNVIVARNVTLNFADVPVFWLPFMVQSLSRGRRSGILMPRFGINDIASTSSRYNRRIEDVGVYWAINDYLGAELAMDWFSNNWTALRGSFDYNWQRQFLSGGLTYRQYWRDAGSRELTLASMNNWQPDERTRIGLNANFVTSADFVRRGTFDPRELNRSIDSNASIQRRFDFASVSLGATRQQFLSDGTVRWVRPSFGLQFSPQTLFEALPGEERWYSNMSWQGSGDLRIERTDIDAANPSRSAQSRQTLNSSVTNRLSLGRFSISQSGNFTERSQDARAIPNDTIALSAFTEQSGRWTTGLSYEQRLIGTSTLTPSVTLQGRFLRSDSTGNEIVSAPMRVDLNSSLRVELFGFWPGVGPFERFRHRVSPSISYSYSPAARADSVQRAVFRDDGSLEQNRISIGLTQTFEAKYRSRAPQPAQDAPADTVAADTTAADTTRIGQTPAGLRTGGTQDTLRGQVLTRRQQVETLSILAISTEALMYDFVRARTGEGLVTTQLRNSLQSDLLRGMQVSLVHDLFRQRPAEDDRSQPGRDFAPHLRQVNASFSLNGNSWLFRVLRIGRPDTVSTAAVPLTQDSLQAGPAVDRTESEFGMIGTSRRTAPGTPRGTAGAWNASINYSLVRPRSGEGLGTEDQMMTGNLSFQATENWSVRWNTGYSFTAREFSSHILTLTRTLHDWDANFDFVKAQNGNFSMQFRVHLRANPDVKLDYSQSDAPGLQGSRR